MTHLITPPAVLRDPFVDQPETRESGDSLYHITLEFSAIEEVRPLIKQIEKLMPKMMAECSRFSRYLRSLQLTRASKFGDAAMEKFVEPACVET